ncbi:MAG TPA: hypothetical protein P5079_07290 [Elusimicrobiota bacterium]|nr:hypothetical protein [Elusimicrobiota bacterium]
MVAGAFFGAAALFPYLYGYLHQDAGWVFTGIVRLVGDNASYLAWAKQAQEGFALFAVPYTTEPQPRVLFLPFFLLVGWAARLTGLALPLCMNLFYAAGIGFFLWALWRWLKATGASPAVRGLAFFLALFSSGFGAFLDRVAAEFPGLSPLARFPTGTPGIYGAADLWSFDFITFANVAHYPVAPVSLGLLLLSLAWMSRGEEKNNPWAAGVTAGVLFLVHPYDAAIAWGLVWMFPFVQRIPLKRAVSALMIFYGAALPAAVYLLWMMGANPLLREYSRSLHALTPSLVSYLVGLGPTFLLALAGAWCIYRRGERGGIPTLVWALAALGALGLPLTARFKLMHGAHIAFCFLAARGVAAVMEWTGTRAMGKTAALIGIVLLFGAGGTSNARLWKENMENVSRHWLPYYLPRPLEEVLGHLDRNAEPYKTVLTSVNLGLFIPAWTGCKTYAGHWDQTLHREFKEREIADFFSSEASVESRWEFLKTHGISYLLLPLAHRGAMTGRGGEEKMFEKEFDNGYYHVYKVR